MWPRPPVTERRDPDGRSTRVGYVLRRCGFERHCGIVTRVCLVGGGRRGEATTVVTASRDGTLKCWDFPVSASETHGGACSSTAPPPQLRCSLEEHTAWVNDAVVLPPSGSGADASRDSRRIVSASNDNLLKFWHLDEERQGAGVCGALMSLRYHVDYVTCLAYAPQRALLVSAGLDSRVVVSDLEAATRVLMIPTNDAEDQYGTRQASSSPQRGGNAQAQAAHRCTVGSFSGAGQYIPQLLVSPNANRESGGAEDSGGREGGSCGASVWSLATTRNASLLVCGTASCVVRGWDPRSGARLWRLRGHTENVRALAMSDDGTICISGSADRTVRVWDVGMRRCVHVFDAHHDSVWALGVAGYSCGWANTVGADGTGAGGMMDKVFSGGRDGLVLVHDLRLFSTGLVVREPSPLQALAVPSDPTEIWAPAADSHVRRHSVPTSLIPYSPVVSRDDTVPPGAAPVPVAGQIPVAGDDCIAIAGTPRLIDYKVLHNKRQVLVRDACDQLSLWDVTNGQYVDFPLPGAPSSGSGIETEKIDDVIKRALAQVNKPVSVPNWFTCDLSLGSLSVYLDANQCFKAESEEDTSLPSSVAASRVGVVSAQGGIVRNGQSRVAETPASAAPVNLGARTLRTLFDSWVRLPAGIAAQAAAANQAGGGRTGGSGQRRAQTHPRIFVAPPVQADTSGQNGTLAQRWDDDQPLGTPADQQGPTDLPAGNSSLQSFPPATGLFLVGRNGRSVGYRGRLYCGLFNGTEAPELIPPWAVDVVWNQRPPPEELCGERMMMFTLMRCPSELALPPLQTPFCVAAPRTNIRRLMGYLVRVLEFDWDAPAKTVARRPGSAVSLVSRLGRCCTVPTARGSGGRAHSSDCSSDGGDPPVVRSAGGGSSRRSNSRERAAAHGNSNASQRRAFGLRRGEEEVGANVGLAGRVRIDGSPAPLPSVPAGTSARKGGSGVAVSSGGAVPDERFVEIVCNDSLVDPDMSLATVRDFMWRKPGHEMILCYRRAARAVMPTSPAPPPPLLSPGGGQHTVNATSVNGATRSDDVGLTEDVTSELNQSPGSEVEGSRDPDLREDGPPRE
mmetsp:Transcript_50324/g.78664  ORF Transcript_50324/g.78664 Transcript_50324/m.78664 type:complete len:1075 (-) Transcript_50324:84-3308(-)